MKIAEILTYAREQNAADIHICAGTPIFLRIGRDLKPVTKEALTAQQSRELSLQLLNEEQQAQFEASRDFDSMVADENGRYRVNIGRFDGEVGSVIRILPDRPKSITELKLPPVIIQCANYDKGLVLITGSTSQGKTTTMAGLINHVNEHYRRHIVTIEDPVEYVHTNIKSMIRQREIGRDTADFNTALRAALR
jgi:Tfp pilus assembly pilus retraction ATPase PilT